jgi:methylamine dehydrogenase accessory protein MauD
MDLSLKLQFAALWAITLLEGMALITVFTILGRIHLKRGDGIKALTTDEGPRVGVPLPEWSGTNLYGESVRSEEFLGRKWVLLFASPGCVACEHFFPAVEKTRRSLPEPVEFVFVMEARPEEIKQAVRRYRLNGTVVTDERGFLRDSLGIERTPYGFMIERDGQIKMKGVVNDRLMLESLIEGRGHWFRGLTWETAGTSGGQSSS